MTYSGNGAAAQLVNKWWTTCVGHVYKSDACDTKATFWESIPTNCVLFPTHCMGVYIPGIEIYSADFRFLIALGPGFMPCRWRYSHEKKKCLLSRHETNKSESRLFNKYTLEKRVMGQGPTFHSKACRQWIFQRKSSSWLREICWYRNVDVQYRE